MAKHQWTRIEPPLSYLILLLLMLFVICLILFGRGDPGPPQAYLNEMRLRELEAIGFGYFESNSMPEESNTALQVTEAGQIILRDKDDSDLSIKMTSEKIWRLREGKWQLRIEDYNTSNPLIRFGSPFYRNFKMEMIQIQ